jgi:hypothetical protein
MDVYWDGPPSMTTRTVINRTFPNLSDFFKKLGIVSAPPDALVEELRAIAKQHQRGAVPPKVQEHIANTLAHISKILQSTPETLVSFQDLAQIPMFPTSMPSEGVTLRTADEFYIPDKSGKYADVFRERVALFALPESAFAPIRPLLESSIFNDRMRYLEAHVTKRSTPLGERVPEPKATDLYSGRVEYIARYAVLVEPRVRMLIRFNVISGCSFRLVYHTNKASFPQRAKDLLVKLRKITIIGVESIATILSVGPYNELTSEDVSFKETDDKFTVFFCRSGGILGNSLNLHICQELSRLLEVDMLMLSTCISHNIEYLHELFEFRGIEEIPDDNVDGSWLQMMLNPNEPVVPAPVSVVASANEPPPSPASPPSPQSSVHDAKPFPPRRTREPKTECEPSTQPSHLPENVHNDASVSEGERHRSTESSVGVSGQGPALLQHPVPLHAPMTTTRDIVTLTVKPKVILNRNQRASGTPRNPVWPLFVPATATDDKDLVRAMGEHYVRSASFPLAETLIQCGMYGRGTRCLPRCWTTLGRTIGQASCGAVPPALRRSVGRPMRPFCTTIRVDSSRASGSARRRPLRGVAVGRGTTLRSRRRPERRTNRFI